MFFPMSSTNTHPHTFQIVFLKRRSIYIYSTSSFWHLGQSTCCSILRPHAHATRRTSIHLRTNHPFFLPLQELYRNNDTIIFHQASSSAIALCCKAEHEHPSQTNMRSLSKPLRARQTLLANASRSLLHLVLLAGALSQLSTVCYHIFASHTRPGQPWKHIKISSPNPVPPANK